MKNEEWIKTKGRLHEKPGIVPYEHVYCLIFINDNILLRHWSCEHLCWDNESRGNFEFAPKLPTHWMALPDVPEQIK